MARTLGDAANNHLDVDLRHAAVTVRPMTHEVEGLSERDVELARQMPSVARELDVPADPTAVQTVQVTIDALVGPEVLPFWKLSTLVRHISREIAEAAPLGRGAC